jgi:hypothetical protein
MYVYDISKLILSYFYLIGSLKRHLNLVKIRPDSCFIDRKIVLFETKWSVDDLCSYNNWVKSPYLGQKFGQKCHNKF